MPNKEAPKAPQKIHWMTVDQAENPTEFEKSLPGEFTSSPIREGFEADALGRRDFMKIMGASAMMASLAGCTQRPVQKIVPYVTNPEEIIPGQPNFYASADPLTGYGLVIKTREGRPIKVDGNTDHPLGRGLIGARGQATVHDLYDPDRLKNPKISGSDATWEELDGAIRKAMALGAGWLLTGSVLSPTLKRVIAKSGLRHVMVDALPMDDVLDGQAQSYGSRVFPRFRFDKADYVLSLGADFLGGWGYTSEYTHQFTSKRRLDGNKPTMSKMVMIEPVMSLTGQNADQRFTAHPSDMLSIGLAIAAEVAKLMGRSVEELSGFSAELVGKKAALDPKVVLTIARELVQNRGRSLVVAKDMGVQGTALQNVANFLNSTLDNEGETLDGSAGASLQFQGSHAEFQKLLDAVRTNGVKTLIIAGVNPAQLFADSMKVKETLQAVPNLVYVGSYQDETAELAKYVAAESHAFEAWGDVSAVRGVYSVQQPTIRPLWNTRSLLECLLAWSGDGKMNATEASHSAVIETSKSVHSGGKSFQDWWDDLLMSGLHESEGGRGAARSFQLGGLRSAVASAKSSGNKGSEGDFTLVLTTSIAMGCGFQANNAILQELPDPISKLTWGNYLAVSPATAQEKGWKDGDYVKVENTSTSVELPVYRQPGMRAGVVSAHLGYGRRFNGRVGNGVGVSFVNFTGSSLTGARPSHVVTGVRISKVGRNERLPISQTHMSTEGRHIVFETTFEEFKKDPKSGIVKEFPEGTMPPSIWSGFEYKGYKWGMSIDMSSCTGCSACVVACSVENNVPSVGRSEVQKNREMQWIRIDRYYSGDMENPETILQPMLCQHCDNAPCETVCPVLATAHSDDGLNQMIYNRCVGTKYCSNNCPYKVRRFNWYNNNGEMNGTLEHPIPLSKNPEVTLRSRGVMEKCTFCVQRIEAGKSAAKSKGRPVIDGEIRTACQDACPANAIVFGNVNDPGSHVAKAKANARGFLSLEETNARPNVTYLTKVRNRAPVAHAEGHGGGEHH